jgi:hypothetical protein
MGLLIKNGSSLQDERETSWQVFCRLRSHYYEPAYFFAETFFDVHALCSGARSVKISARSPTLWPELAEQWRLATAMQVKSVFRAGEHKCLLIPCVKWHMG